MTVRPCCLVMMTSGLAIPCKYEFSNSLIVLATSAAGPENYSPQKALGLSVKPTAPHHLFVGIQPQRSSMLLFQTLLATSTKFFSLKQNVLGQVDVKTGIMII